VGEVSNRRVLIALACMLVGAAVSGLLLFQHHGEPAAVQAVNEACGDGATSGCEQLARSRWSSVGGTPIAAIGTAFSLVLAGLFAVALGCGSVARAGLLALALLLLGAALGVDVALAGVQAFAARTFCGLCVATYALNAAAFYALWPARGALRGALPGLHAPENRPALVAAVLTTLGFLGTVIGTEHALEARSALRSATLLGAPTAPAAEAPPSASLVPPSPPGSGPAERWRSEAQRLQAILDDPQKLDQYFDQKAAREYAEARPETIDLDDIPRKGTRGAPVQVVEYSDFLCPFCRNLAGALTGFLPQAGNRIEIFYKNYPLEQECNPNLTRTAHPGACALARGAICAQAQGKFWPYHDRVFGEPPREGSVPDVLGLARQAGLDAAAFGACLGTADTRDRLAAQVDEAKKLGVTSTPTLFLNGKKLPRINDFVQVVDQEAQAKGFAPLRPAGTAPGH
jgi:protein-disulfide isomerase/uncharacterized membrane protein